MRCHKCGGYRFNPDEDIRRLELKAAENFDSFLKYRRTLARSGLHDILRFKKGMFTLTLTNRIEYIKSRGPNRTTLLPFYDSFDSEGGKKFLSGKGTGKAYQMAGAQDELLKYYIIVPPELAEYIEIIRAKHYLAWATDPNGEPGKKWWVTHYPAYQEELYFKIINELEQFGYFQPNRWPEIYCSGGCGRNMGVATVARRRSDLCYYCWEKKFNLGESWLEDNLSKGVYPYNYRPMT